MDFCNYKTMICCEWGVHSVMVYRSYCYCSLVRRSVVYVDGLGKSFLVLSRIVDPN